LGRGRSQSRGTRGLESARELDGQDRVGQEGREAEKSEMTTKSGLSR